jgi:hypothetical protein
MIHLPDEVLAFLADAEVLRDESLYINPLSPAECARQTELIRGVSIADALGLIVLDDANDSNPFCYVTVGPARGMVLHFSHDFGPAFRFLNLSMFLAALRAAHDGRLKIDHLPMSRLPPHPDQSMIRALLQVQLASPDEDAAALFTLYVRLLDPRDLEIINLGANNVDFLVREAVAEFLADNPLVEHRAILTTLASDGYPQVCRPAQQALATLIR